MFKKHNSNESVLVKQMLGLHCKLTSYNIRCDDKNMFKKHNSNESVGDKQALSVKSSNEVLEAIKQKKIVKVKSRMQNKIETTDNSSINLKHESLINCQNNIKEMTKNDSQIRLELKKFEQSEIRLKIVELETEARILKRRIFDSSESNDITGIKNGL